LPCNSSKSELSTHTFDFGIESGLCAMTHPFGFGIESGLRAMTYAFDFGIESGLCAMTHVQSSESSALRLPWQLPFH
jgi:hypothetical protein